MIKRAAVISLDIGCLLEPEDCIDFLPSWQTLFIECAEPLSSTGSIYDVADRLNRILNGAPMFEFIRPHEWIAPKLLDPGRYSGIF